MTRNLKYDILTKKILDRELHTDSNCIDVGAHKGEILDIFLDKASRGRHSAFEPIPEFNKNLQTKYEGRAHVFSCALSDRSGTMLFNVVLDDPAYSGLKKRSYKTASPTIESIEVEVRLLDEALRDREYTIHLIKIDVEGGELDVLKGATEILKKDKPLLLFEFGKGASEYYGTMPHHMFELLDALNYSIRTLDGFWKKTTALTSEQLRTIYESGSDYYFVASYRKA